MSIRERINSLFWLALRVYALGLAAFIAAFGAFCWRTRDKGRSSPAPEDTTPRDDGALSGVSTVFRAPGSRASLSTATSE